MVDCVRENDLSLLSRILTIDTDNKKAEEKRNAALISAREGFAEALRILFEVGKISPDMTDDNGWTLLRTAAWSGQEGCVKTLCDIGANVNKTDAEDRTALRAACWAGHINCVRILLEYNAEINQVQKSFYFFSLLNNIFISKGG